MHRRLLKRVATTAAQPLDGFPFSADPETGEWVTTPDGAWTGGFWIGGLWHVDASLAEHWLARLRPRVSDPTSLRGLLFWYGAGEHAPEVAAEVARALANDVPADVIPLHTPSRDEFETNIDGLVGTAALLSGGLPMHQHIVLRLGTSPSQTDRATRPRVRSRRVRFSTSVIATRPRPSSNSSHTVTSPSHLTADGRLLDGCYHRKAAWADHHEVIWGDFFLLEATLRVLG
jgi:hypothetical protein